MPPLIEPAEYEIEFTGIFVMATYDNALKLARKIGCYTSDITIRHRGQDVTGLLAEAAAEAWNDKGNIALAHTHPFMAKYASKRIDRLCAEEDQRFEREAEELYAEAEAAERHREDESRAAWIMIGVGGAS